MLTDLVPHRETDKKWLRPIKHMLGSQNIHISVAGLFVYVTTAAAFAADLMSVAQAWTRNALRRRTFLFMVRKTILETCSSNVYLPHAKTIVAQKRGNLSCWLVIPLGCGFGALYGYQLGHLP